MLDLAYTVLLFMLLLGSVAVGWSAQHFMRERRVSPQAVESIRLLMGMLLTFSALVLGLLTSSAKQRFDGYNSDLSVFSADLIELDHRLRLYGPGADDIRVLLRRYTAAAIADTWPNEPNPIGTYPRFNHAPGPRSIEGTELGDMLSDVDVAIEQLAPQGDFQRELAARLRDRVAQAIQQRWALIFSARSTISWPFLVLLTSWLLIIFGIFGLTTPRSRLLYVVVGLSAASIASPVYLILDYSEARSGALQLSSDPMRSALLHIDRTSEGRD